MRWSVAGADNLAKIIYTRENGDLNRIIEKYDGEIMIPNNYMDQVKVLSADQVKQVVGKGNKCRYHSGRIASPW